jgi:alpha-D-ribose 1-methylphosphonate 5-triphosphate synthase subunit PhnH
MTTSVLDLSRLAPGFQTPVHDAQATFRAVLDAMAHPGRIVTLPVRPPAPMPLGAAAAAIALTLCDIDTPVWLDPSLELLQGYLSFHTGSPIAREPRLASFAFAAKPLDLPPLDGFALGTDEYPDRSTTLVLEVASLGSTGGLRLNGPGIDGSAQLAVDGLPPRFWEERALLGELLPRGLDIIFTSDARLAALPRSTRTAL